MLNQRLQQKLLQKLSPQQIQLIKLLEIPTLELEQRIKKELEENPALEEGPDDEPEVTSDDDGLDLGEDNDENEQDNESSNDNEFSFEDFLEGDEETPYYNLSTNNYSKDDERKEIPFSGGSTYHESLLQQIGLKFLTDRQQQLAEYLIGNLDEDGYLRRDIPSIVDDIAFLQNIHTTEEEMYETLRIVQDLDPAGTGARDLQECLMLQITRKNIRQQPIADALNILQDCFPEFTKKHYDKIMRKLSLSDDALKNAINEILKLNPRPGNAYSDPMNKNFIQITPDFLVENIEGKLNVSLNSRNAPELRVSPTYSSMLQTYSNSNKKNKTNKEALNFVKQKIDSARWFIDAIRQRQFTLLETMSAILRYQYDFFIDGEETSLKPMILKDIAEETGLDISTISRVANSKFVQTQHGIFPLKYFFSEGMQNESGEEVSTREIKKILQDEIDKEDKLDPLTDEQLAEVLKQRGYPIARRTVAKYREQLNIPVGRLRKEL